MQNFVYNPIKQLFTDILLNVLLPLLVGTLIYYQKSILPSEGFIINQFPDGCWAYAFASAILIIWNRQINPFWIFLAFMVAVAFEVLQSLHFIRGTGDLWDILAYFFAMLLVLICNRPFKKKLYPLLIPTKSN